MEALGLREGDDVTLHVVGKRALELEKTPGHVETFTLRLAYGADGETIVGQYGTLVIASDGSYTYTLDNTDPQTQALAQRMGLDWKYAGPHEVFAEMKLGMPSRRTFTPSRASRGVPIVSASLRMSWAPRPRRWWCCSG